LASLRKWLYEERVVLVVSSLLLTEIEAVAGRDKLKRYFSQEKVEVLLDFLNNVAQKYDTAPQHNECIDPR
jgi:putative PIN family toxin of toxin-antitoxin system